MRRHRAFHRFFRGKEVGFAGWDVIIVSSAWRLRRYVSSKKKSFTECNGLPRKRVTWIRQGTPPDYAAWQALSGSFVVIPSRWWCRWWMSELNRVKSGAKYRRVKKVYDRPGAPIRKINDWITDENVIDSKRNTWKKSYFSELFFFFSKLCQIYQNCSIPLNSIMYTHMHAHIFTL